MFFNNMNLKCVFKLEKCAICSVIYIVTANPISFTSTPLPKAPLSDSSNSPKVLILLLVSVTISMLVLVLLLGGFLHIRKHRGTEKHLLE